MKKSILLLQFIFSTVVSSLFQGCTKQLDEVNLREPVADGYYNLKQGYLDLINACYTNTRSQITGGGFCLMEYGTDLWTNASDAEGNEFNSYLPELQASNAKIYSLWSTYYLGIAACNTAISRSTNNITGMTQAEIDIKVAEAYFLRAWYYSILVMNFGGVPLVTEEVTTVQTTASRATEVEVYAQVIADLLKAETLLPKTQADVGRTTKPAAQAMLARVYLWIKNYPKAEAYAKTVISDGGYTFALQPTFAQLWNQDNQVNNEIIWAIQFSRNLRINDPPNALCLYFTPRYDLQPGMQRALEYSRPYPRFMATRWYLDLMQANRWRDSRYDAVWLEAYKANYAKTMPAGMNLGDTAYIVVPYVASAALRASKPYKIIDITAYYNGENTYGALQIYPTTTKYHDKYRDAINSGTGTRDVFEIRLAEMYLIACEALYMQPGKAAEALPYINEVRKRAAKPGHIADMMATVNDLSIDFILDERALELGAERYRWIDLKRTGKLIERVKLYNPAGRSRILVKHLVRPIPSSFLDRLTNKADFIQNPDY